MEERERERASASSLSKCSFGEALTYKYCISRGLDHLLSPHSKPSPQIPAETCISMTAASSQQSHMVHMLLTPISWIHPQSAGGHFQRAFSLLNPRNTHLGSQKQTFDVWDTYSSQESPLKLKKHFYE